MDLWDTFDEEDLGRNKSREIEIEKAESNIMIFGDIRSFDKYYFAEAEFKEICKKIKPEEGYESIAIHGTADEFHFYLEEDNYLSITPEQLTDMLKREADKEDSGYEGGNIRLLSCRAGEKEDGIAYQLSQLLKVDVMAPTMDLYVDDKSGELLITNDERKVRKWQHDKSIESDGEWKIFQYREEV